MSEINWFGKLPTQTRADIIKQRAIISTEDKANMLTYGKDYFDSNVPWGYGGYHYDGRFEPVVQQMIDHYNIDSNSKILEVGCAKGYLLYEFYKKGISEVHGLDISDYAISHVPDEIKNRCYVCSAHDLSKFSDNYFDLVISKDVLHNLPPDLSDQAIREMARVGKGQGVVQLGAYNTENQKFCLQAWIITIKTVRSCDQWRQAFTDNGYTGDYYFLCHDYAVEDDDAH